MNIGSHNSCHIISNTIKLFLEIVTKKFVNNVFLVKFDKILYYMTSIVRFYLWNELMPLNLWKWTYFDIYTVFLEMYKQNWHLNYVILHLCIIKMYVIIISQRKQAKSSDKNQNLVVYNQ
jgi:hypothetical protein